MNGRRRSLFGPLRRSCADHAQRIRSDAYGYLACARRLQLAVCFKVRW